MAKAQPGYTMRISRLTVDKLGVKLYDKASAVVAELVANSYDADATQVTVRLPLGTELASKDETVGDKGYEIVVVDNGHGMTPQEAQDLFLWVGTDRRQRPEDGARSRNLNRRVMGRKGIGKLSPFGICRCIEVLSAGGEKTAKGYLTSHFLLDFEKIVTDDDAAVPLDAGDRDRTYSPATGTTIRLTNFLPKRVPTKDTFTRQLARRFALAGEDFDVVVEDTRHGGSFAMPKFQIALNEATKINVNDKPVKSPDGTDLPVKGWLAFAKDAYRNEEEAGIRIYARGKIVATTRDFEQPAGFTGEFTTRSYLVGEVHAEWLDADEGEDLIRTDRQGILWDSEFGEALRSWGASLIREIGAKSKEPRRKKKQAEFMERSRLEDRAWARYGDKTVVDAVVSLGKQIGAFASEDELDDEEYIEGLAEVILATAPHQALIGAFKEISNQQEKSVDDLLDLFGKTRVAEMASYAQIAAERVQSVNELEEVMDDPTSQEANLQGLIARAPWLIRGDWSVISDNRSLKTFRDRFQVFWKNQYGEDIDIAISKETKRPDFTLVSVGHKLHVVELKAPKHTFGNADYERLENYLVAFEKFFSDHQAFAKAFPHGWQIELIADRVHITNQTASRAYAHEVHDGRVVRSTWNDFLERAKQTHSEFLDTHDRLHTE